MVSAALVCCALGCNSEGAAPSTLELEREGALTLADPSVEASARINRFTAAPDWNGLVELLAQPHASARALLGPHKLSYTANFRTGPAQLDPALPLPPVRVGEPVLERFEVEDQLELRWASAAGESPRLRLEQFNQHQRGRGLIVVGEQAWSKLDEREWLERPLETNLWQLWADDAQAAVLDLVELAGPHADINEIGPVQVGEREALRVTLRASDQRHGERVVEALEPWRRDAEVQVQEATLILDAGTGLWLAAQIDLRWTFRDSAGRELSGSASFDGRVEPSETPPLVEPPPAASPLPERDRPELLRQRMLDGLAAY